MKITLKSLALTLLAAFVLAAPSFAQQNLLVQTTLSAAVAAPTQTTSPPTPVATVQLASTTGIVGYALNPTTTLQAQQLWVLYVDREEMAVIQISGGTLQVVRGYNSTVATSHVSGSMVLYGKAPWFYNYDPGTILSQGGGGPSGGLACTVAGSFAFPWLNVRTGSQWECSSITLQYIPYFNNAMVPGSAIVSTAVASAAGQVTPSGPLFHITGGLAITGFLIPVGCNATAVGGCSFTVIPDGTFTWTTANNIALAGTAVVNKLLTFSWDGKNSKWIPSYIA